MDLAIKSMLNRKKLKYAVQAAYWAAGGQKVGGVQPADISERVFCKVRDSFAGLWAGWDANLQTVLTPGREDSIKEAFLWLFLGQFVETNFQGVRTFQTSVDCLPPSIVKWLTEQDIVRMDNDTDSGDAYRSGYVPWRPGISTKRNRNHAMVIWALFRANIIDKTALIESLKGLFQGAQPNQAQRLKMILQQDVGPKYEKAKNQEGLLGGKQVTFQAFNELFPRGAALSGLVEVVED